jgi:hypothetical protein
MSYKKFDDEELTRAEKGMVQMRSITNYVMGIALVFVSFCIFFPNKFVASKLALYDETSIKLLGVVCAIYGIFRIYRGYMKNYFRES